MLIGSGNPRVRGWEALDRIEEWEALDRIEEWEAPYQQALDEFCQKYLARIEEWEARYQQALDEFCQKSLARIKEASADLPPWDKVDRVKVFTDDTWRTDPFFTVPPDPLHEPASQTVVIRLTTQASREQEPAPPPQADQTPNIDPLELMEI